MHALATNTPNSNMHW